MDKKDIDRINELYHKSKEGGGLTEEEAKEQHILRQRYLAAIRQSLLGDLSNVKIKEADGSITDIGEKIAKKRGN